MLNQVRSEYVKVRSTQVWIWMLLLAVGFTSLLTVGTVYAQTREVFEGIARPDYFAIFTAPQSAAITLVALGVLGFTTEFRYQTITPTLLATPNRRLLVVAKTLWFTVLAVAYAAVCMAVNLAISIPWLAAAGYGVELGGDVPLGMLRTWILLVYAVLLGLGFGALIRHQAAAMVTMILYFTVLNGVWSVIPFVRRVWPFTPAGSAQAFASNHGIEGYPSDIPVLGPAAAGVIMLVWVGLPLALSARWMARRDIS